MSDGQPKNMAASVCDRLLIRSRETGEDYGFLLQRYAAERFLYRLGQTGYRDHFVLKGAMLFALWGGSIYRATRDLDFTGYGSNATEAVHGAIGEICQCAVDDDGLFFNTETLRIEPIRDDTEYHGLRIKFQAALGNARIPLQIDIGFANAIEPPASEVEYPTLLNHAAPRIRAYPHEAVVAEKFHTMVVLGEVNSRYKDFYDLYVMARQFSFDGAKLMRAVGATFERRKTVIEQALPIVLTPRFYADVPRAEQWRAYLTRNSLPGAPPDFEIAGELLQSFLRPIWDALATDGTHVSTWTTGEGWK